MTQDDASLLRRVLDGVPALVSYWDRDLRNVTANAAYADFLGLDPGSMRGRTVAELFGDEAAALEALARAALAGEPQVFDRVVAGPSGRERRVQCSFVPDVHGGEVRGFFVLGADITERYAEEHRASQSLRQFRALARSLPAGFVLLFDSDLRILIADGIALSTFGYTPEQLEGRRIFDALPSELSLELAPRYRSVLSGETVSWDREIGARFFRLTAGPVLDDDGSVLFGTVTASDLTLERRAHRTWEALHRVATLVARQEHPQRIAQTIAAGLVTTFNAHTASVVRFVDGTSAEILAIEPGMPRALSSGRLSLKDDGASAMARVGATGRAARIDYTDAPGEVAAALREAGMRAGLSAPIRLGGSLWGAISVATVRGDEADDDYLRALSRFAELVELALGNNRDRADLERLASLDQLTGLTNRRVFEEQLEDEVERSRRSGEPLSLAILDLDHFKQVNDQHGHPVGDQVLRELSRVLRTQSRGRESLGRLGGEEFGWLLPGTSAARAYSAAERVRRVVASVAVPPVGRMTVSIGVAGLRPEQTAADLVEAADTALYEAKRSGRNRVVSG